jgi:hypothetical protein
MDWFKNNPFLGILGASTLALAATSVFLILSAHSDLLEQQETFSTNTSELNTLQTAKPFPNNENLAAAEAELAHARRILAGLATAVTAQSAPRDETLTPQKFQDELNARATEIAAAAAQMGVALPENFYLGFEQYRAQLPVVSATPALGQQLSSIAEAVSLLISARVTGITALERDPLPEESGVADQASGASPDLHLAPFQLSFAADQSSFRAALTALTTAQPVLLLKLLEVANSAPSPPSKEGTLGEAEPAEVDSSDTAVDRIPVVFGREAVAVRLGLASISARPAPERREGGGS